MLFRKNVFVWAAVSMSSALSSQALIVVDDFNEAGDGSTLPLTATWPNSEFSAEIGLSSPMGQYREVYLFPAIDPSVNPQPIGAQVRAALDPVAGTLTIDSDSQVASITALIWFDVETGGQTFIPADLDMTAEEGFLIHYQSSLPVNLLVSPGNGVANGSGNLNTTGGSRGRFTMPAGSGVFFADFAAITESIRLLNGTTLPAVDYSSVDTLLMQFSTRAGDTLIIDRISVVPEPVLVGLLPALALFTSQCRRS